MPLEDWAWIVGINQWGPIYGCHQFVPTMKKRGSGHVLNVAWIAAFACGPQMEAVHRIMEKSAVQADEVARRALAACERGKLYVFPHTEAKAIAALKRLPETMLRRIGPAVGRRFSSQSP